MQSVNDAQYFFLDLIGVTNIKGKGNMRTYFVCMDEHYKIQYIDNPDVTTSAALDYRNKVDCTHL